MTDGPEPCLAATVVEGKFVMCDRPAHEAGTAHYDAEQELGWASAEFGAPAWAELPEAQRLEAQALYWTSTGMGSRL